MSNEEILVRIRQDVTDIYGAMFSKRDITIFRVYYDGGIIMFCLDIPMPQNCGDCPCARIFDSYTCMAAKRSFDKYPLENRMDWCPAKTEEQVKSTAANRQKKSKDDDISTYQEYSYMRHPDRVEMGTY